MKFAKFSRKQTWVLKRSASKNQITRVENLTNDMENHGAPIPKKVKQSFKYPGNFRAWIKGFKFQELSLIVGA